MTAQSSRDQPLDFIRVTRCGTGVAEAAGGGETGVATRGEELPFSLRRSCQGFTTFIQSSRVPIIEIAVPKGITK